MMEGPPTWRRHAAQQGAGRASSVHRCDGHHSRARGVRRAAIVRAAIECEWECAGGSVRSAPAGRGTFPSGSASERVTRRPTVYRCRPACATVVGPAGHARAHAPGCEWSRLAWPPNRVVVVVVRFSGRGDQRGGEEEGKTWTSISSNQDSQTTTPPVGRRQWPVGLEQQQQQQHVQVRWQWASAAQPMEVDTAGSRGTGKKQSRSPPRRRCRRATSGQQQQQQQRRGKRRQPRRRGGQRAVRCASCRRLRLSFRRRRRRSQWGGCV